MPGPSPLEAALLAGPRDLRAWAVYADWLSERDDPRGEALALDVRLAGGPLDDSQRQTLQERLDTIRSERRAAWLAGLALPEGADLRWWGGFVVAAWLPWDDGTPALLEALEAHPTARFLTSLDLTHRWRGFSDTRMWGRHVGRLARCALLRRITHLDLTGQLLHADGASALASSRHVRALETLKLDGCRMGARGATALVQSPRLRTLRALWLGSNRLRGAGAVTVAEASHLRGIETLGLQANALDGGATRAFVAALDIPGLVQLDLSQNPLGPDGAAAVAGAPLLGTLTRLSLADAGIRDAGAQAIARSAVLGRLTELQLAGNGLTADGVRALARCDALRSVEEVSLDRNALGAEMVDLLADRATWPALRALHLRHAGLEPDDVERIVSGRGSGCRVWT
jgi:uncharacterized protein (TIGR02996 family)